MGVMAGFAVHDNRVYMEVGFSESLPLEIVAFSTQGLNALIYQSSLG